jgi:threonine/homoserine/homoserine lactone efflux protein
MTAMAIFMGLCVAGMLVLLRFLVAWFSESSAAGGSYLVKLGVRHTASPRSHSAAASATGRAAVRAA